MGTICRSTNRTISGLSGKPLYGEARGDRLAEVRELFSRLIVVNSLLIFFVKSVVDNRYFFISHITKIEVGFFVHEFPGLIKSRDLVTVISLTMSRLELSFKHTQKM